MIRLAIIFLASCAVWLMLTALYLIAQRWGLLGMFAIIAIVIALGAMWGYFDERRISRRYEDDVCSR